MGFNLFSYLITGVLCYLIASVGVITGGMIYWASKHYLKPKSPSGKYIAISVSIIAALLSVSILIFGMINYSFTISDKCYPRPISSSEVIIGEWVPTTKSIEIMQDEGGYKISTHKWIFSDDGSFEMVNMPDWLIDWEPNQQFYSGKGKWSFSSDECSWRINLSFAPFENYPDGLGTSIFFGGKSPNYYLYDYYLGGADSGNVMYFEKSK